MAFNTHFTEIGKTLANKIPKTDTDPISCLKPTNNKSSGLHNIPNMLLKMAVEIVSQSHK